MPSTIQWGLRARLDSADPLPVALLLPPPRKNEPQLQTS
jgi:hypothetical protein